MTTARMIASMSITESGQDSFSGGPHWSGKMDFTQDISSGVLANQADLSYMQERNVAASTNDDVDLAGVIADILGNTITAAKLVAMFVINAPKDPSQPANVSDLTIGGGTNFVPGFGAAIPALKPGGTFFMGAGNLDGIAAITAGTGDIIRIANGAGGAANYQLGLLMRSS